MREQNISPIMTNTCDQSCKPAPFAVADATEQTV